MKEVNCKMPTYALVNTLLSCKLYNRCSVLYPCLEQHVLMLSLPVLCRQASVENDVVLLFDCMPPAAELERKLDDLIR